MKQGLPGAPLLRNNWKWMRIHENIDDQLLEFGQFGEYF